jgi:hypothetical protein
VGPDCRMVELQIDGMPVLKRVDYKGTLIVENMQMDNNNLKRGHTEMSDQAIPGIQKRTLTRDYLSGNVGIKVKRSQNSSR